MATAPPTPTTSRRGAAARPGRGAAQGAARSGFTLAESLVASVVLAITVIGIASALSAAHQQSAASDLAVAAVQVAKQAMEQHLAGDLTAGTGNEGDDDGDDGDDGGGDDGGGGVPIVDARLVADEDVVMNIDRPQTFHRQVLVERRSAADGPVDDAGSLTVLSVVVTAPDGRTVRLTRLLAPMQ